MKNLMKKLLVICALFMGLDTLNAKINVPFLAPIPDLSQYPEFKLGKKPKTVEFSIDHWIKTDEQAVELSAKIIGLMAGSLFAFISGGILLNECDHLIRFSKIMIWLAFVTVFGPGLYLVMKKAFSRDKTNIKHMLHSLEIKNRSENLSRFVSTTSQNDDWSTDLHPFGTKVVFVTSYPWAQSICDTMNKNFERLTQKWWEEIRGYQLVC